MDSRLLLLVLAGVPGAVTSLWFTRQHRLAEEETAPDARLAEHLWRTTVAAGPAKEVRVFNLQRGGRRAQRIDLGVRAPFRAEPDQYRHHQHADDHCGGSAQADRTAAENTRRAVGD